MMTLIENNNPSNKLFARVKNSKKITYSENEVIKKCYGCDSEIPQTIYNRIQQDLDRGEKTKAILKIKLSNGDSYWVKNNFTPSHYSNDNKFSVSSDLINENEISALKKLYTILNKIENKISIKQANKFLDGFLELHRINFNQLSRFN